jgi:Zn-dependent peptidase ImmA (M78 family)
MKQKHKHIKDEILEAGIDSLDAGWATFQFKFTSDIPCAPDECAGYTNLNTYTIYVDDRLSSEYFRETLLHEITHVLLEITGYTNPDEEKQFNPTNEELATNISRGFLLLARLNPTLFKILVVREHYLQ